MQATHIIFTFQRNDDFYYVSFFIDVTGWNYEIKYSVQGCNFAVDIDLGVLDDDEVRDEVLALRVLNDYFERE